LSFLAGSLVLAISVRAAPGRSSGSIAQTNSPSATPAPNPPPAKHSSSHPSPAKKGKKRPREQTQHAPLPGRIREIQQALVREGHYQGEPTGKWDEQSVAAMKSFQQASGLQPSGKIEARSLQKLGLGSATAGLAEPRLPGASDPPIPPPKPPIR
jgi:murein L,D-transpeptidase YcbB/YkuD